MLAACDVISGAGANEISMPATRDEEIMAGVSRILRLGGCGKLVVKDDPAINNVEGVDVEIEVVARDAKLSRYDVAGFEDVTDSQETVIVEINAVIRFVYDGEGEPMCKKVVNTDADARLAD